MVRCVYCMEEYSPMEGACPICNCLKGVKANFEYQLPPETLIEKRYYVGLAYTAGAISVKYIAYDMLEKKRVWLYEFYPKALAVRGEDKKILTFKTYSAEENFGKVLS